MNDGVEMCQQIGFGKDALGDVSGIIDAGCETIGIVRSEKGFFAQQFDDRLPYPGILQDDPFGFAVTVIDRKTAFRQFPRHRALSASYASCDSYDHN